MHRSLGRYFFITTFDDEEALRDRLVPAQTEAASGGGKTKRGREKQQKLRAAQKGEDSKEKEQNRVERYVHIDLKSFFKRGIGSGRVTFEAKAVVKPEYARFELVDRRDRQPKALLESDWIPEESQDGQPFFIRQFFHVNQCIGITGFHDSQNPYNFCLKKKSHHQEGKCHMLFQLIPAKHRSIIGASATSN